MRRLTTCLLTATFALTATLAACGDDDTDTTSFSEGYNAAIQRLAQINDDLGQLQSSRSSRAIAREFDDFAGGLEAAGAQLERLQPPEAATSQFDDLVGALDETVEASRRAADAAREIKPVAQRRAVRELRRASERVAAAEDALRQAVESPSG
jgi:hypothetical protein